MKPPRSPYDTLAFLFLSSHAEWLLRKMNVNGRIEKDRGPQLLEFDGSRRFADLIFDLARSAMQACLVHIEIQSRYSRQLLLRMADYKLRILRRFGSVHLIQVVLFLRRPPAKIFDRLSGEPQGLGYYWRDMTVIDAEDYFALNTPIATVMAVVSQTGDPNLLAQKVVKRLERIKNAEERCQMIDSATDMAGVRPDSEHFIEVIKFTAEQLKTLKPWDLTPKEEWDAAIRYAMRGLEKKWKAKAEGIKKGKKEGIEEGIKEGMKEGIMASKYEVVRNLAKMGLSIADISQAVELPPETVQHILSMPNDVSKSDA